MNEAHAWQLQRYRRVEKKKRQGRLFLRQQVGRTDDGSPEVLRGREPEEKFALHAHGQTLTGSHMIAEKRPTPTKSLGHGK